MTGFREAAGNRRGAHRTLATAGGSPGEGVEEEAERREKGGPSYGGLLDVRVRPERCSSVCGGGATAAAGGLERRGHLKAVGSERVQHLEDNGANPLGIQADAGASEGEHNMI